MKDVESQTLPSANGGARKPAGMFGSKSAGYKRWVLAAILLLACWSVFTGSVSLKWSFASLGGGGAVSGEYGFPVGGDDLDILEVEEREKVVRRMWELYVHKGGVKLPRFWRAAFEAAYEFLVSDSPGIRNAAVSDIAKLSLHFLKPDPLPPRSLKEAEASGIRPAKGKNDVRTSKAA